MTADTVRCQRCGERTFDLVHEHCGNCGAVSLAPLGEHGRRDDDPVPNESECCFPCEYHSCLVVWCEVCDEMIVWQDNPDRWRHIDPPQDGHESHREPPEHWDWIKKQTAHIDG